MIKIMHIKFLDFLECRYILPRVVMFFATCRLPIELGRRYFKIPCGALRLIQRIDYDGLPGVV